MTSAAASWIEHEFADVQLGDARLDQRYRTVLVDLTRHCGKTVCRSLARSPARMKAAYRFFDNARVRIGDMLAPHVNRTAERVRDQRRRHGARGSGHHGAELRRTCEDGEPGHRQHRLHGNQEPRAAAAQHDGDRRRGRHELRAARPTLRGPKAGPRRPGAAGAHRHPAHRRQGEPALDRRHRGRPRDGSREAVGSCTWPTARPTSTSSSATPPRSASTCSCARPTTARSTRRAVPRRRTAGCSTT